MIYIDDSEPEGELEPAFPYRDVTIKRGVDANTLYDILGEVGRGKFGTVYQCQDKANGLKLAAKFVPIPKRDDKRNVEREVELMNSLQHHLIIQLYAAYEYQKMMCVVLELVEGGELFDRVVDDEFVLTERVCVLFIRQVCQAMEFIHRNNILHLDLKPENILCLTQEGNRIKLIDFGLARKYDPNKRLQILFGTPEFVAPEVVNFDCISYATDMWSVGVICYVLISGLSPFMGETDIETMANVTIAKYDFEDESFSSVSPDCLNFISKLLVKDLDTRMTAAQCLEHKWLQRRAKPPPTLHPKPLNLPPPKLKATPSPSVSTTTSGTSVSSGSDEYESSELQELNDRKELDTTKDNLKHFIERWEEHPNSPYIFDVEGNVIAPLNEAEFKLIAPHAPDSMSSSRVCSPSPCASIDTITDNDADDLVFNDSNSSPGMLATPINECHEPFYGGASVTPTNGPTPAQTPTPGAMGVAQQYASQHLFGSRWDQLQLYGDNDASNSSNSNYNNISDNDMDAAAALERSATGSVTGGAEAGERRSLQQRSIKSYLHTFDRRNSDTNYLLGRRSSGERINLADEIRKLSDHLLMLAEINSKLGSAAPDINGNSDIATAKASKNGTATITTTTSIAASKTTTASSSSRQQSSSASKVSGKLSSLSQRLEQSLEQTPKLSNGTTRSRPWQQTLKSSSSTMQSSSTVQSSSTKSSSSTNSKHHSESTVTKSNSDNSGTDSPGGAAATETANTRRAKFRITHMSRDVPVGLPDTHQTVNLEEAANNTKDCLLHLLEKYNETKCRNPVARHQSISVDWNVTDNLEYRSMSSINAFFQRHNNSGAHVKQMQAQLEQKTTTPTQATTKVPRKGAAAAAAGKAEVS